ncbi:DUF7014 domain-containing protein [Brenneria goodwinii]|uniref:DUF7014 domain-containing protein n=1 Tax=Brenneria goodwinii TaxID=1109412 RepID=UPI003556A2BE
MLETGIPTIRNRNSGHGQGSEIKLVIWLSPSLFSRVKALIEYQDRSASWEPQRL